MHASLMRTVHLSHCRDDTQERKWDLYGISVVFEER